MRIASKFQHISKLKKYDDYVLIIRNHFIKIMMEDQTKGLEWKLQNLFN